MFTSGTIVHSIYRGLLIFVSFAGTYILTQNGGWETVTLGTVVAAVVHYISSKIVATS